MICENCKIEKKNGDFINNDKLCYRCRYQEKLKKVPENQDDSGPKLCRICNSEILRRKGLKKRQRTVYCSLTCAVQGHKLIAAGYWTRNISI